MSLGICAMCAGIGSEFGGVWGAGFGGAVGGCFFGLVTNVMLNSSIKDKLASMEDGEPRDAANASQGRKGH